MLGETPFFVDPRDWTADRRPRLSPALQDIYILPPEIIRMDARVQRDLVAALKSSKSLPLHNALRNAARAYVPHKDWACNFFFRATFHVYWCHDLAWYGIGPPVTVKGQTYDLLDLHAFQQPFKRQCHHCRSVYGFKGPTMRQAKKDPGDVLKKIPIPTGIKEADLLVQKEILRLRADGGLDKSMKKISKSLEKIGRGILSYSIVPISLHFFKGDPVAIAASPWLSPAVRGLETLNAPHRERSQPRDYFRPCSFCRGEGGIL